MGDVVLRTHGGLGNQLFQILYGRLWAEQEGRVLREVHDLRYRHAFPRSDALRRAPAPGPWQRLVSAGRLPKVLQRTVGRAEAPLHIGRTAYLDAYFQSEAAYRPFPMPLVARHLDALALELAVGPADLDGGLVHLRLGDFFADRAHARAHVIERLGGVAPGTAVMTNDEALLQEPEVAALMRERALQLVSTSGMHAEDVLRTMARYREINANDSTLTYWSSVLGGCRVTLRDPVLRASRDHLVACRQGGRA